MWRCVFAFSTLALIGAVMTGCAVNRFERREAWRDQAENMCLSRKLVQTTAYVSLGKEIEGPGPCGMQQPFKVTRLGNGSVALKQRVTLACPALAEAEAWLADTLQPAAQLYFGVPVAEINAGSYSCRGRNNQVGAKLSEHSFGNALDIMSVTLADGHVITVKGGWRGTPAEQGFLREVFTGACARFSTVLGPGSDMFHYDHVHVDLARHDPRGLRRICKPKLNYVSQLGAEGAARAYTTPRPAAHQAAPEQAPIDVEQDDPYGVTPTSSRASGARYSRGSADATFAAAPSVPAGQTRQESAQAYDERAAEPSSDPIY